MKFVLSVLIFYLTFFPALAFRNNAVPTASFTATTVCQGLQTVFTNNSFTPSGSIIANIWDFGDGTGSTALNPKHIYENSGLFTVTLTVVTSTGDVDDYTADVTVYPSGTLNFNFTASDNCVGSQFSFTNLSNLPSGSFTSYSWDFGDNGSAGTQHTSHSYVTSGTYMVKLTTLTDNNCSNSFTKTVDVFPKASVDFTAQDVCFGNEIGFTNTTTVSSGMITYIWNFGDNNTSTSVHPEYTYTNTGEYTVELTATTEKGCQSTSSKTVNIYPNPEAAFAIADHCLGETVQVTNQTTISSGSVTYGWDFGDGTSSAAPSPVHTFSVNGSFTVKLNVESDHGCKADAYDVVYVNAVPEIDFSFENICVGNTVQFINNSSISTGDMKYNWSFGDGASSLNASPSHGYATQGIYDVMLTASNFTGGCQASVTKQIQIFEQPLASFSAIDQCLNTEVSFVNETQFSGTGISYQWNFGNGTMSVLTNPTLLYGSAQSYTVTLTATTDDGCIDDIVKTIRVYPMPVANFLSSNVCDRQTTTFDNLSSISSGSATSAWTFGDGTSSTETSPEHIFPEAISYIVTLTMTSDHNCIATKVKTVQVNPLPVVDFTVSNVCDGEAVVFDNTTTVSSGSISAYQWNFGDETTSIVKNPSKEYLDDDTYTVTLNAISNYGCQGSAQHTVTVFPSPIAAFSVNDVCNTQTVQTFNSSSISSGTLTYEWDLGDGTNSITTAPAHKYNTVGVYLIKLLTMSDKGCIDSVSHPVAVLYGPTVSAGADQTVSKGYPAQLNATGGTTYAWSPIDGLDNSSLSNPTARPLETTTYIVFATDKYGCESSDTVTVYVNNEYKLVATNVLTPDNNGANDTWNIENVETFGDVNVKVFDRWGALVYQQDAYKNDWRGTSGGDLLPDGTYYYYVTFSSSSRQYKGSLTIMRNRK